jgi:hypothetical protein
VDKYFYLIKIPLTNGRMNKMKMFLRNAICLLLILSTYTFAQWETVVIDSSKDVEKIFTANNKVFVVLENSELYVSNDHLATWNNITSNLPDSVSKINEIISHNNSTYMASNFGVHVSNDFGNTWKHHNTDIGNGEVITLHSIGNILLAGRWSSICRSTTGGNSWTIEDGIFNFITDFTSTSTTIYARLQGITGSPGLWRSEDLGITWRGGLEYPSGFDSFTAYNDEYLYFGIWLGSSAGLYLSKDKADSYVKIRSNAVWSVHNVDNTLLFSESGPRFYYAKLGVGDSLHPGDLGLKATVDELIEDDKFLYAQHNFKNFVSKRNLSQFNIVTSIEQEILSNPKSFSLAQNYPNPFNPSTKIKYELPESGFVSLTIYNLLGKEIAKLVNESKPAGKYIVEFNAQNLASGTYIYRLNAGNFSKYKKMLLIK